MTHRIIKAYLRYSFATVVAKAFDWLFMALCQRTHVLKCQCDLGKLEIDVEDVQYNFGQHTIQFNIIIISQDSLFQFLEENPILKLLKTFYCAAAGRHALTLAPFFHCDFL